MTTKNYWIPVDERLPRNNQKVYARYEGVYENRGPITFWIDPGEGSHFGLLNEEDGKGSQPATHWIPEEEGKLLRNTEVRADPPWLAQIGSAARVFMVANSYPAEAVEALGSVEVLRLAAGVIDQTLKDVEARS